MLLNGTTQRNVAQQFNVSQSFIGRLWQFYQGTGDVVQRQGRRRKTTEVHDRHLVVLATRRHLESAWSLHSDFQCATGVQISTQTIRNRLHAANLYSRKPAVRQPLAPWHWRCRLQFAHQHADGRRYRFRHILYTDKSKFYLDFHDGRRRVWRQKNERFRDCCVDEHNRFGGDLSLYGQGYRMTGAPTSTS